MVEWSVYGLKLPKKINNKMKYKLIFALALVLVVLPMVQAEVELTFAFNSDIDLKRPCFNNGTFCSSSATCSITVSYPDSTILLNDQNMNNNRTFHNISITADKVNQLGIYPVIMSCTDGALSGDDTFDIEITADGFAPKTFPIQLSFLIIGYMLVAVSMASDKLKLFRFLGAILIMIMGVVTIFPGYAGVNYTTLTGMAVGGISIALGFYFLIQDALSFDNQTKQFEQVEDGRFHEND